MKPRTASVGVAKDGMPAGSNTCRASSVDGPPSQAAKTGLRGHLLAWNSVTFPGNCPAASEPEDSAVGQFMTRTASVVRSASSAERAAQ
jgi:hypothetical protein